MDIILHWNAVALDANRISHTPPLGEQLGPPLSARALAIVHLAMHDAFFSIQPGHALYCPLPVNPPAAGMNVRAAVSAAASTALVALYPSQRARFERAVLEAAIEPADADVSGAFGRYVADRIVRRLIAKPSDVSDDGYAMSFAWGRHRTDPDNPTQGFHAPFYGDIARWIAVSQAWGLLAPPRDWNDAAYVAALDEVIGKGGAPSLRTTTRTPKETLIGHYWAYDGASMLGTPPRMYNQIIRGIAIERGNDEASNARLFALVNAAMGDAGTFAWREKYRHDLWRPVLGVREHDRTLGPAGLPGPGLVDRCDPYWLPLGAPRTNTTGKSFTPPFPAYPSGHATFGAAAFQMVRLHYGFTGQTPDDIKFRFVSAELDGLSVDQNGTVRTRHVRHFDSLWDAIFENGVSRVYLGVHWVFDAFDAKDVKDANGNYKKPKDIKYSSQVGGVKLGLDIANNIFGTKLVCSP